MCLFPVQEVTCSLSSCIQLVGSPTAPDTLPSWLVQGTYCSTVEIEKETRSAVQAGRWWCYLVGLHALTPLALHTHDGHSHTEVELLVYRKGGEEFGDHAVYLQLHFTLRAVKQGLGHDQTYLAAESG